MPPYLSWDRFKSFSSPFPQFPEKVSPQFVAALLPVYLSLTFTSLTKATTLHLLLVKASLYFSVETYKISYQKSCFSSRICFDGKALISFSFYVFL